MKNKRRSTFITITALLVTAGLVAGASYFYIPYNKDATNITQNQELTGVSISQNKANGEYQEEDLIELTAIASPKNIVGVTYKWYKNGNLIEGANSKTYKFIATTADNNANITVAAEKKGIAFRDSTTVMVRPLIKVEVQSVSIATVDGKTNLETNVGDVITLWAKVNPTDAYLKETTYQWYKKYKNGTVEPYGDNSNKFGTQFLPKDIDLESIYVEVLQNVNGTTIKRTSNEVTTTITNKINYSQKLEDEKNRLNGITISNKNLTQEQLEKLTNNNQETYKEILSNDFNFKTGEGFSYQFKFLSSDNNTLRFWVNITLAMATPPTVSIETSFNYTLPTPPPPPQPTDDDYIRSVNEKKNEFTSKTSTIDKDDFEQISATNILDNVKFPTGLDRPGDIQVIPTNFLKDPYPSTTPGQHNTAVKFKITKGQSTSEEITVIFKVVVQAEIQGETPEETANRLFNEEVQKWRDAVISEKTITKEKWDILQGSPEELQLILSDLINDEKFLYYFEIIELTKTKCKFNVTIYWDGEPQINLEEMVDNKEFTLNVIETPPQKTLDDIVNELNAIDWNAKFDYAKFGQRHFWEIAAEKPFYNLKYTLDFDPANYMNMNDVRLSIEEGDVSLDILKQKLNFTITIKRQNETRKTNQFTLTYKTPQQYKPELDLKPIESGVAVPNSLKDLLIYIPKLDPLSDSLFKSRVDKTFNEGPDKETFRKIEMLYHARFIFHQSFADNATSIDYGFDDRGNIILKAKVKNTIWIENPYIQILQDEQPKASWNLREGEIIEILLANETPNEGFDSISNDNALGGPRTPFFYEPVLNSKEVANNSRAIISMGLNLKKWQINIKQGNQTLYSRGGNLVWRMMFSFLVPCLKIV